MSSEPSLALERRVRAIYDALDSRNAKVLIV